MGFLASKTTSACGVLGALWSNVFEWSSSFFCYAHTHNAHACPQGCGQCDRLPLVLRYSSNAATKAEKNTAMQDLKYFHYRGNCCHKLKRKT